MLKINYFASVREQLGLSSESLDLPAGVRTAGDLADYLPNVARPGNGCNPALTC